MLKKRLITPFVLIIVILAKMATIPVHAQVVSSETLDFRNFIFHDKPPKYLASRKTAVLISVPRSHKNPTIRSDWKKLASQMHKKFKQMKIDAVAYYYTEDVLNNADPSAAFAKEMAQREIKYLILAEQTRKGSDAYAESYYKVIVTPFNGEATFVDQNSNAWKIENSNLDDLLRKMFNAIYKEELVLENYLIPDFPEFFTDIDIIKGKRIPTYAMDLKVEKLIVPKFQKFKVKDSTKLDQDTRDRISQYNQAIDEKNKRLATIMKTYPLPYEISDDYTDKEVYNKGGQFVLLRLDGTGQTIKEFLDYKTDPTETVYATIKASDIGSTVLRLPSESVVSKFYVKHVFTKDIYTGLKWDADLTWEESLHNFIFNMKDVLNVK